jgi:hypothetical protein
MELKKTAKDELCAMRQLQTVDMEDLTKAATTPNQNNDFSPTHLNP